MAELENTISELLTKIANSSLPDALVSRHAVALAEWEFKAWCVFALAMVVLSVGVGTYFILRRFRSMLPDISELCSYVLADQPVLKRHKEISAVIGGCQIVLGLCIIVAIVFIFSIIPIYKEYILLSEPKAWALEYIRGLIPGVSK